MIRIVIFFCTSKDIGKLSSKYVKEYSRQYWAFNGANDNLKGNITYNNYQNRLLSDHFSYYFLIFMIHDSYLVIMHL